MLNDSRLALDQDLRFSPAIAVRYAFKMRPPMKFIPPQPSLGERLLHRAMAHEMRAIRLRDLAKLVVEPTVTVGDGRDRVSTLTTVGRRRTTTT